LSAKLNSKAALTPFEAKRMKHELIAKQQQRRAVPEPDEEGEEGEYSKRFALNWKAESLVVGEENTKKRKEHPEQEGKCGSDAEYHSKKSHWQSCGELLLHHSNCQQIHQPHFQQHIMCSHESNCWKTIFHIKYWNLALQPTQVLQFKRKKTNPHVFVAIQSSATGSSKKRSLKMTQKLLLRKFAAITLQN
jgi:hypothetical protein